MINPLRCYLSLLAKMTSESSGSRVTCESGRLVGDDDCGSSLTPVNGMSPIIISSSSPLAVMFGRTMADCCSPDSSADKSRSGMRANQPRITRPNAESESVNMRTGTAKTAGSGDDCSCSADSSSGSPESAGRANATVAHPSTATTSNHRRNCGDMVVRVLMEYVRT